MFQRKNKIQKKSYDKENLIPVLKCSICTGEQVAGFQNKHTGKFDDVMLIQNEKDLNTFKEIYDIQIITKIY